MRKKSEIEEYEREAYSRVWLVRKQAMFWDIFEGIDSIEVEDLGYCLDKIDEVCEEYDDVRYIGFSKIDSQKINEIILRNIPNDLDIIKYKILKGDNNGELRSLSCS